MDWPRPIHRQVSPLFITTAEAYVRFTGKTPVRTSRVWGSANRDIFLPVFIPRTMLVKKLYAFNGTAVSGNCDIGIYQAEPQSWITNRWMGPGRKIVAAGSTAQAGTSQWQAFNITDKILPAGWYWLGYVLDNLTGQVIQLDSATAQVMDDSLSRLAQAWYYHQGTPFPLPDQVGVSPYANALPLLALGGIA